MSKTSEKLSITDIKGTEESITRKSLEENGITKSIEVRKVENGYIVEVREEGYKKDKWINNKKTYISKTDPLEEQGEVDKKESFKESLNMALTNLKL